MKPTEKQKIVINVVAGHIKHWQNTNDINSPSHWNLNDERVHDNDISMDFRNELDENGLILKIGNKLSDLLSLIRQIK